jgi:hypothetical protein
MKRRVTRSQHVHGNQYNAAGDINITELSAEDPVEKGRNSADQGYRALLRADYASAQHFLEEANYTLPEKQFPEEAAQIKYHYALALLQGRRPFWASFPDIKRIEQLLTSAISLHPLHSYYHTLALIKRDFARHGLLQYKQEMQKLKQKAMRIPKIATDRENLQLLAHCQPQLVKSISPGK